MLRSWKTQAIRSETQSSFHRLNTAALIWTRVIETMRPKVADYLTSIASLFFATTFEFPQWIPLGCDLNRMPTAEPFRIDTAAIAVPVLRDLIAPTKTEGRRS